MFSLRKLVLTGMATAALALGASVVTASTIVQKSFTQVSTQAELVFEGRVSGLWTETSGKKIYTWIEFEILDVIKGNYPNTQLSLRYLGGSSGDITMKVDRMAQPEIGEQGIYFVNSLDNKSVHPLVGWGQGHFILKPLKAGGELKVHDSKGRAVSNITSTENKLRKFNASTASGLEFIQSDGDALSPDAFKEKIREISK